MGNFTISTGAGFLPSTVFIFLKHCFEKPPHFVQDPCDDSCFLDNPSNYAFHNFQLVITNNFDGNADQDVCANQVFASENDHPGPS